jgi:hypothetical protein
MADDKIEPRIMASSTVRPTLVVAPSTPARTPGLTPGVSTVDDVKAVVLGMTPREATRLLEPLGYVVDLVPAEGSSEADGRGSNAERVILAVTDGRVTGVAFG